MPQHEKQSRSRRLAALAEEINSTIPNAWLFPTRGKVQGFMGGAPVMFVAERPSTGHFGGPADHLLYALLEKYGAADSHLTDVIKSRGLVKEPYPDDMTPHRRIFDHEIEIVRPRLIVAFGQKVYDLLQFSLAGSGIKVRQVWHYSYARRGRDKAAAFEKQIQESLLMEPGWSSAEGSKSIGASLRTPGANQGVLAPGVRHDRTRCT